VKNKFKIFRLAFIIIVLLQLFSIPVIQEFGSPVYAEEELKVNTSGNSGNVEGSITPIFKGKFLQPSFYRNHSLANNSRLFHKTLSNGLKVIVQEKPGCGIVSAELIIKVGVVQEMESSPGIITLIQYVLLRGGGRGKFIPLQEMMEADGCVLKASAKQDYAYIRMMSTKDSFRVNFKRMIETIKAPAFNEKLLEEERKKLIFYLGNNRSAYQHIYEIFLGNFYRYHPYRQPVYGSKSAIKRIKLRNMRDFYEKYYVGNRMTLAICGDINGVDMLELCTKTMSDIPSRKINVVDILWEPVGQEKKLRLRTSSNIAWIFWGFPAPGVKSPDYPAMKVLHAIWGQGLSSRLFIELREKEGLAYELDSNYPRLEGPSHMILYAVTNGPQLHKCRKKIFKEMNLLKMYRIGEKELEAGKHKVIGKLLIEKETTTGQAHNLAFNVAVGLGRNHDQVPGKLHHSHD